MAKINTDKLKNGLNLSAVSNKKRDDLFEDTSTKEPIVIKQVKPKEKEAEDYSARVTLPISREQKRFIDQLSASLQGDKPQELINRNTLLRAMIRLLQESKIPSDVRANSEDELLNILRKCF